MRRPTLISILAVLVLGTALAGGLYWRWYHSPRYALQQMALALKHKNMDNFFNYLDLKEIFNNILETSSKDLEPPEGKTEDDWDRLTRRLGRKFARNLLPRLFDTFEKQIRGALEQYLLNLDNSQVMGVMAAVTVARIQTRGDEAEVCLTDPKTGDLFRFRMRRFPDGTWRIVTVTYEDLKKFLKREWE
jgi:hypothetical protein